MQLRPEPAGSLLLPCTVMRPAQQTYLQHYVLLDAIHC